MSRYISKKSFPGKNNPHRVDILKTSKLAFMPFSNLQKKRQIHLIDPTNSISSRMNVLKPERVNEEHFMRINS